MRLIVVRHGQTQCNLTDLWHSWDDCRLTEEGRRQAAAVAERLAGEPIVAIYSSDSPRALETAQAIAQPHGLAPRPEPGLRERHAGDFEGRAVADVKRTHPTYAEDRAADWWGWSPPGGESFAQVRDRVMAVVERLKDSHDGQTVALVTHMCPMRILTSQFTDMTIDDTYYHDFPSTGVTIFRLEGDEVDVEILNDASHVSDGSARQG